MANNKGATKQHRTMQGKAIDLDMLRKRNELTPAVGNMKVNARGDELGPGGKIVRSREDILREYYENNPQAVPDEQAKTRSRPQADQPAPQKSQSETKETQSTQTKSSSKPRNSSSKSKSKTVEEPKEPLDGPTATELAEWEEDEEGNFVRKDV